MNTNEKGLTLVEVMVASTILAVSAMALGSTYLAISKVNEVTANEMMANNMISAKLAEMRDSMNTAYTDPWTGEEYEGLAAVVARYQSSENMYFSSTENGEGGEYGGNYVYDPKAITGWINLHLGEQYIPEVLGGPRDLNGDGEITNVFLSSADKIYLLPIEVQVTVPGQNGQFVTITRYMTLGEVDKDE